MSRSESSSLPDDTAAALAALHSLRALEGKDAAALDRCRGCQFRKAAEELAASDVAVGMMAAACFPPVTPPPASKDVILARIAGNRPGKEKLEGNKPAPTLVKAADEEWVPLPGGKIRMRVLSDLPDASHTLLLLDVEPGGSFAPHTHKGAEEIYVISGECDSDGVTLHAGDYLRLASGSRHDVFSHGGCRAMVITARENHPRIGIGLYTWLRRRIRTVTRRTAADG